jgi:hypothetical protein
LREPLETAPPLGSERDFARRPVELGASMGVSHKLCPTSAHECTGTPGVAFGLAAWSRPSPHFAWGVELDHTRFVQWVRVAESEVRLDTRGTSLALGARAYPLSAGAFDPYVGLGFGGGQYGELGELRVAGSSSPIDAVHWVPLLAVGAGLDVHVDSALALGAHFGWQHWLLGGSERCHGVAFGVCTLPSRGHFDVDNAVWRWRLGATFLFGAPH